ncbi:MAG: hydroxymethylbilane synthase [Clostridia bacterium]|nr:hydroxymethylbilane synthase [Clostridia bacterium]
MRLGTRGSPLALGQAELVAERLVRAQSGLAVTIVPIRTAGDRDRAAALADPSTRGLFTAELSQAVSDGRVDLAAHSLKDLPLAQTKGTAVGAVLPRAPVEDVLVSRTGAALADLPPGARVGTGSPRRRAQLLRLRPDLHVVRIRGNVDTRVRRALDPDGPWDAVLVARAALERLGLWDLPARPVPLEEILPAPGQGAIAVECRDDEEWLSLVRPIGDPATLVAVTAERAFLAGLGGGCALPVAAHARVEGGRLVLRGRVTAVDGSAQVDLACESAPEEAAARAAGWALAKEALARGAGRWLR